MRRYALVVLIVALGLSVLACRGPRPAVTFLPVQLPLAQISQAYQVTLMISDNQTPAGHIYVAEGALPPGLALTHERGEDTASLSGTPEAAGEFVFTVAAWCLGTNVSGQRGQHTYTLSVR